MLTTVVFYIDEKGMKDSNGIIVKDFWGKHTYSVAQVMPARAVGQMQDKSQADLLIDWRKVSSLDDYLPI